MDNQLLSHARIVHSVAYGTREDARTLLRLAVEIPARSEAETLPFAEANRALQSLKSSKIHGAGVRVI